jgi:hypothetical protein
MTIKRKEAIRDEMISRLEERLRDFWEENAKQTTTDSWRQDVSFTVSADGMSAATERILTAAKERIVLLLLNERSLDPERLTAFAERWLRVSQSLLEEQADAVTAEL